MRFTIKILELRRETKEYSNGPQDGLTIVGEKEDGKNWEKFLTEYHNPKLVQAFERIGKGVYAVIEQEKKDKFWNIIGVKPAAASEAPASPPKQSETPAPPPKQEERPPTAYDSKPATMIDPAQLSVQPWAVSAEFSRLRGLEEAIKLTLVLLTTGLLKKASADLVGQTVLDQASQFADFISGKLEVNHKSNAKDLKTASGAVGSSGTKSTEKPDLPSNAHGDDNIPY